MDFACVDCLFNTRALIKDTANKFAVLDREKCLSKLKNEINQVNQQIQRDK